MYHTIPSLLDDGDQSSARMVCTNPSRWLVHPFDLDEPPEARWATHFGLRPSESVPQSFVGPLLWAPMFHDLREARIKLHRIAQ